MSAMSARRSVGAARRCVAVVVVVARPGRPRRSCATRLARGERARPARSALELVHVRNDGVAFGLLGGGGVLVALVVGAARSARCSSTSRATATRRWCGCRPACCSAARVGNLIDRVRDGARDRLHQAAALAGVQRRRHRDHGRRARAAVVVARAPRRGARDCELDELGRLRPRASGSTRSSPGRSARARARSG